MTGKYKYPSKKEYTPPVLYSDFQTVQRHQPMGYRELATLIEELGEAVVAEILAENQPACGAQVVMNRLFRAGPIRWVGKWIEDGAGRHIYLTEWSQKENLFHGKGWEKKKDKKTGKVKARQVLYDVPYNCIVREV